MAAPRARLGCSATAAGSRAPCGRPAWSLGTYLGGALDEHFVGVGLDDSGNIHVVGTTTSPNFPTQPSVPYAPPPPPLMFVGRLDPTGSSVLSSVLLAGFAGEFPNRINAVAVDGTGNVYVTGVSLGELPVVNAAQPLHGGGGDAFVTKVGPTGVLAFSTYLGGGGWDVGTDIAVDAAGRVHVVGTTYSGVDATAPFPVQNAWQASAAGDGDVFAAQLDAAGAVEYATYLGGETVESDPSVATDASGTTWVAGETYSGAFPTTPGSWRPAARPGPFLHSTDGGSTWAPSTEPLRERNVTAIAIAIDPSDAATVYVGTAEGGIYRSVDGGNGWTLLHRTSSPAIGVFSLAVDGGEPATIYAAVEMGGSAGTVLRSQDGGDTWGIANIGLPGDAAAPALVIDPDDPQTLYGVIGAPFGLYRSDDGADSWTPIALPDTLPGSFSAPFPGPGTEGYPRGLLAIDPTDADHLVLAGHQRVAQSFDRGETWTVVPDEFGTCRGSCTGIGALAMDPSDPLVMYLAGTFGFAKTTDGGQHWDVGFGCLAGARALIVDPKAPAILYGIGFTDPFGPQFARSSDGGASWAALGDRALDADRYNALALAPGTPTQLYAGLRRTTSQSFVTRLAVAGAPVFSTYAGRSGTAVDVDAAGNVFLPALSLDQTGMPRPFAPPSAIDPSTVRDLQVDPSGRLHLFRRIAGESEFVATFDPVDPEAAVCVSLPDVTEYYDLTSPLAVNADGDTYVGIMTTATDLAVAGAYQPTNAGAADAFVAKIDAGAGEPLATCVGSNTTTTLSLGSCVPTTTTLPPACGGGLPGADCRLNEFMSVPLCNGEAVGARLQRFIERKALRARGLFAKAGAHAGRKRVRALRRADRQLRAIQQRTAKSMRKGTISDACGERIRGAIEAVRDMLATAG